MIARRSNQSTLKEINPKYSLERHAAAPILCPSDAKSRHIGQDAITGKNRRKEKKGVTEGEKVGWHHQLNGHEFE